MIYTPMTKKAMRLAFVAHQSQVDKSNIPYINHPLHLAEEMDDEVSCTIALLHDVVEDTQYTFSDLEKEFPKEVIDVLRLLTHEKNVPYSEYIKKLSSNEIARKVKCADLKHNMDVGRLEEITERDKKRIEKYKEALSFLLECDGGIE
ncbi:MAG: HD domain-containing protein [Solobacterium sp.]|nr:HD domain-containing protein [Solobacterium sp.]